MLFLGVSSIIQVWTKYATNLSDLAKPAMSRKALSCLNELVSNALSHVPDVLQYLSQIKNQTIFNFCAIPQVSNALVMDYTEVYEFTHTHAHAHTHTHTHTHIYYIYIYYYYYYSRLFQTTNVHSKVNPQKKKKYNFY